MSVASGSSSSAGNPWDDQDLATVARIINILHQARQQQGFTLRELGKKMKVDFSHLGRAKRGVTQPSLMIIFRWCRALDLSFEEVIKKALHQ